MRTLRAALCAAAAVAALGLGACGSEEQGPAPRGDAGVVGKQWQVIGLYTAPDAPSGIPRGIATVPQMSFGESSVVGDTGCAAFTAEVSFSAEDKPANIRDAEAMRVDSVRYDAPRQPCEGSSSWAHNLMHNLISEGHEFDFTLDPNNQLVLTLRTGAVDSPSIQMTAL
ncbi:hypothetical protein [Corynebacterium sp.]|uniref:hypothetical protein n=1 Tax=Corynebacterium sp. TaxID=1720 RepID=UPI0026DBC56D|nr:hypothetical protein [Corynebacterium sp.]MDO5032410.1 hypothetical protein [Corynebacterium sp.]